jgi:signal transduction histidine kinase/DNA-binding response OmpR family regulator
MLVLFTLYLCSEGLQQNRQFWASLRTERKLERRAIEMRDMVAAAEQASQAKGEFLANMSHEIRTPMNGVMGMTGLILDTPLNEQQRHYAVMIRNSADSLLAILNDILDISKIESGKVTLERVDFNLRTLIEDVAELMAPRAQERGLELVTVVPPALEGDYVGDPARLRQVLTNLVGNAVKFTETGEIVLEVKAAEGTIHRPRVRIECRDTGFGIPADRQKAVFESFTQADGSTTRRFGGTGLGLTICRKLMELMSGQIGLSSAPGRGSTFWIEVPLERQTVAASGGVADLEALGAQSLQGLRLMVATANDTLRDSLHTQLSAWGCSVEAVASGKRVLHAMLAAGSQRPYQALVIDADTLELNGIQATAAIRAHGHLAKLPVILLTAATRLGSEDRIRALAIGAQLNKPVRRDALLRALIGALRPSVERPALAVIEPDAMNSDFGWKALLAEDDEVNQIVAAKMLEKFGIQAEIVTTGVAAVGAWRRNAYDMVFMDLQMPEMDGYMATGIIRSEEATTGRHIPIIAMTAHALAGDRAKCIEAGMDEYVSKPIRKAQLLGVLERIQECMEKAA